jgi:hypothetical protein
MRAQRRARSCRLTAQSAELLEVRTLLSASSIAHLAATTQAPAVHSSVVSQLAAAPNVNASTTPANGVQNPYGVAFVPQGVATSGKLHAGDILVSNFNNSTTDGNLQGTGTTIVEIAPNGRQTLFFQGPKGLGLTTALGVLRNGFVLVGNVPTSDGTFSTIQQGSLLILDKNGNIVANLKDPVKLDGPWDLTLVDDGNLAYVYVSNFLNGTVTRLILAVPSVGDGVRVISSTTIGSGYAHRSDPNALVVGPTGLAFNPLTDTLYVASTDDNAIYAIPFANVRGTSAGKGNLVFRNPDLRGPLGLVLLPDGNLIAANGDAVNGNANQPSELVEFTPTGQFVGQTSIDSSQGSAFGIAAEVQGDDLVFAAVDDSSNSLLIWDLKD